MKRLLKWSSAALIALIAALAVSMSSCNRHYDSESKHSIQEYVDSADLYRVLNEFDNPTFTSLDDVCTYYQNEKQYRIQDSVFFSMPPETVANVYTVLVRRGEKPTKMSIANEYLDNIKVYSNLPKKVEMTKVLDPSDIPNTEVIDTIIDGKHVQLLQTSKTTTE